MSKPAWGTIPIFVAQGKLPPAKVLPFGAKGSQSNGSGKRIAEQDWDYSPRPVMRFCLALVYAIFLQAAAWASERVGDVEVSVQPLPSQESTPSRSYGSANGTAHGYVEFRVQLKNSSAKEQVVHLRYPGNERFGRIESGIMVARSVRIASKQEVSVSLFQPPVDVAGSSMEVRVEGVPDAGVIPVQGLYGGARVYSAYNSNPPSPAVLLSRSVPQDFRDRRATKAGATSPAGTPRSYTYLSSPPQPFQLLRSELPVSQWSGNWLGYSCYDVILVTQKEVEQMPAQVQSAIRRYIECGGTLLVHGQEVPAILTQGAVRNRSNGEYWTGFGRAVASRAASATDWDATYQMLATMPVHIYQPMQRPEDRFNFLVKEATVPVRGLFVLVLLFGIGIGPINVWLLSRYKRRIWLWWNVPTISLLTCLAIFCYASFSEGWRGHGKVASFTFLDEGSHRATTIGYLSYYCPLTPWAGPHFGVDTDVALLDRQPDARFYRRNENNLRSVDWTNDQYFGSGWVTARVPAYFQFRKNEDRRERLTVQKNADGSLAITNALGADIRRLCLADASGRSL